MKKPNTKKDIRKANRAIAKVAARNGESEKTVRAAIEEAMQMARSNPDPAVQERWKAIAPDGGPVTPEQLMVWFKNRLKDEKNSSGEKRHAKCQ